MTMTDRIDEILASIDDAKAECGRTDEIKLMAVSKTHPYAAVEQAVKCGLTLFGENRVQEIQAKFPAEHAGYELHLIGHLQSNKVKKAVAAVDAIDSIDSLRLARKVSDEAEKLGKVLPVLIEWNTSGENSKSGFTELADYEELLAEAQSLPGISFRGLMTIGPLTDDERQVRQAFARLREIAQWSGKEFPHLTFDVLSMGMSQDYRWAIKEGSTVVRIGTAIFGRRDYQ